MDPHDPSRRTAYSDPMGRLLPRVLRLLGSRHTPHTASDDPWGFGRLFGTIKDAVIVADAPTGKILLWNKGAESIFQYTSSEATSLSLNALIPPRLQTAHSEGMTRYRQSGHGQIIDSDSAVELPALRKDGAEILIQLTLSALPTPEGFEGTYVMGILREVTKLREAEQAMQLALEASPQPTLCVDLDNKCSWINVAAASLLGYSREELMGRDMHEAIHHSHPDGSPFPAEECKRKQALDSHRAIRVSDEVYWRADGSCFPVEYQLEPLVRDGVALGAVVTFTDITERLRQSSEARKREMFLRETANTDPLTGVGNRRLVDRLLEMLSPGDALVLIDLDNFKLVNDRLGHQFGDRVLIDLAEHLKSQLRDGDEVARYGGEEFLVVLRNAREGGIKFATRMAVDWASTAPAATFSAGVAIHHEGAPSAATFRLADQALYQAKRNGRNCVVQAAGEVRDSEYRHPEH
jgi:diguanylate cyclase (GGDEF)-like protein/PAS domain S-box-containing protein